MKELRKEELEILKFKELLLVYHQKKLEEEEKKMKVNSEFYNHFNRNQKSLS